MFSRVLYVKEFHWPYRSFNEVITASTPVAYISLAQYHGASVHENAVSRDVVGMVVRVDHKLHRQLRQLMNLGQQLPGRLPGRERVDDSHAVFADHESRVGPIGRLGLMMIDRSPRIRSDRLQPKCRLRERLCARAVH
jgi:hypothetical protein